MENNATPTTTGTKPCANCGNPLPIGILCCAHCQREHMLAFFKARPWLVRR